MLVYCLFYEYQVLISGFKVRKFWPSVWVVNQYCLKFFIFSTGIAYFTPKFEYYCLYFHCLYFKMSVSRKRVDSQNFHKCWRIKAVIISGFNPFRGLHRLPHAPQTPKRRCSGHLEQGLKCTNLSLMHMVDIFVSQIILAHTVNIFVSQISLTHTVGIFVSQISLTHTV